MTYQQASIDNLSSKLSLRNDNRAKNIANLNFTLSQAISSTLPTKPPFPVKKLVRNTATIQKHIPKKEYRPMK
jgi:hypothetical protein